VPREWHTAPRSRAVPARDAGGTPGALLDSMKSRSAVRQTLSLVALVAAVLTGCASSVDSAGNADGGATPAKDGAKGGCCEPSTGGCANVGGYQEDGDCSHGSICDNMCEQRIVDDIHGCKKMVYKTPPVATSVAGTGSCSDPIFNGQSPYGKDAGGDGNADAADAQKDASGD
jgi:hypothetical protein